MLTNFVKNEEEILKFWDENEIFKKSVEKETPNCHQPQGRGKDYVFYDGPPFGTGEPHYGHLLSSICKDVVPRYWTMRGYRVERRWGWDCHGLPIENIIEKDMGISGKKQIEEVGVAKFNEACRKRVLEYADIWDKMIHRIARWVEFKNSYKTMDMDFMESVWWGFKQLWDKNLIYQGRKVLLYCPRCETPISNFEVAMDNSYKEIEETSVYAKFKVKYRKGKTGRGVGALILNERNEVLLVRRKENGRRVTWALPGGKVENGESFREALIREVNEELCINIESMRAFSRQPDVIEGRLFEGVFYEVKIKGEPKIGVPDELDKLEWFSLDNLPDIDYPPSREAITIYKNINSNNKINEDITPLPDVYILAWTTTPWTLPANVALAINNNINYVMVKIGDEYFVLAKDRIEDVIKDKEYKIITATELKGKDLVGLEYEPLFDVPALKNSGKKVYYVAPADFVTTEEGTGVVHTAVVYGEDDYNLGLKLDLPVAPALDEKGYFNDTVPQYKGVYFKDADKMIVADLEKKGLLFEKIPFKHSYPFCWRCDTQLFYNAIPAWFIDIQKLKKRMLELNEKINWYPEHLKNGRFAQGIEQAPDWNISRNRYFATPIPIWECAKCEEREAVASIEELERKSLQEKKFYIMRHGEAESNVKELLDSSIKGIGLTEKGMREASAAAVDLKNKNIDLIISSDMERAAQTAEILKKEINVDVVYDRRLREINVGDWNGDLSSEHKDFRKGLKNGSLASYPNGENWMDVKTRIEDFYNDLLKKYSKKNILIIGHADWLAGFESRLFNFEKDFLIHIKDGFSKYYKNAEIREYNYKIIDLHSHNIDFLTWKCAKCGGEMRRIKEVFDCWVESGSMSFAQMHYPFENKEKFEKVFPAQFIVEYISQTRAWFYVMHVLSTAIFNSNSFENVLTTGVILNEKGEKMSKSKKNFPDPNKVINEFGADALRLYLMNSTVMRADNLFFNEKDLRDIFRKNIMLLWNVYTFYEMYAEKLKIKNQKLKICFESNNVLDKWILARLADLINEVTEYMNCYDMPRSVKLITEFIGDLSTWYLRRSRDRFKGDDAADKQAALATTKYVLIELAKVMSPFTPFIAEEIWQKTTGYNFGDGNKSVHLEPWPSAVCRDAINLPACPRRRAQAGRVSETGDTEVLKKMARVKKIVEIGMALRAEQNIKVRQALAKLEIKKSANALEKEYLDLIKDELNVKEVALVDEISGGLLQASDGDLYIGIDTALTLELKQEGFARELVRQINVMRKNSGLTINDRVKIYYSTESEFINEVVSKLEAQIIKDTLADEIILEDRAEMKEVKVGDDVIKLEVEKI